VKEGSKKKKKPTDGTKHTNMVGEGGESRKEEFTEET
jgi:hypothetical protein